VIELVFVGAVWIALVVCCFAAFKVGGDYDEDT